MLLKLQRKPIPPATQVCGGTKILLLVLNSDRMGHLLVSSLTLLEIQTTSIAEPGKNPEGGASPGSQKWVQDPNAWVVFHCFSKHISRDLDWRGSIQNLNHHPHERLALQAVP